jgi:hypothetical protein
MVMKLWVIVFILGLILFGIGIWNLIMNLIEFPPIRIFLPFLLLGIILIIVSMVKSHS